MAAEFVAFLRAVNVGGRIVKMPVLKRIFDDTGMSDVRTFIASGNVVFRSSRSAATLEPLLERALHKALGYEVATMVRTLDEVRALAEADVFGTLRPDGATVYVGLVRGRPTSAAIKSLARLQSAIDTLEVRGGEVHWLARKSIAESTTSPAAIEKALQVPVTFRNLNTLQRLATKYGHPPTASPTTARSGKGPPG